jgi:hypothetical protein
MLVAAAWPLSYYARMRTNHQIAIDVLVELRARQQQLHRTAGGYAIDLATLLQCQRDDGLAALLERLAGAGYVVTLRAAAHESRHVESRACGGRVAADYYVSVAPRDASVAAQHAFAARADGEVFMFFDGIPPGETDMSQGLAVPLSARDAFVIP